MKKRLVKTFEEENNFNNAIVPLTMNVDEVVFIYHHDISKKRSDACKHIITKYKNIDVIFKQVEDYEVENLLDENTIIDISASKYLSSVLFENALKMKLNIIYYDEENEVIKCYNQHKIIAGAIFKLNIEDIIELGGGEIISNLHEAVKENLSKELIYKAVENKNGNYSSFINFVNRVNQSINDFKYEGNVYYTNKQVVEKIMSDDQSKKFSDLNLFRIEDTKIIFANEEIRKIFTVSGAFLENYIYHKLVDSKKFDDIIMSAKIKFNIEQRKYPVTCEIDCIVLKDNRMLLTSIKSNKVDVDDLNEIKVHDIMFGNKQSKPAICLHSDLSENKPSVYAKAEELKVYIIDEDSFVDNKIVDKFLSIIDDTYKYDKLR